MPVERERPSEGVLFVFAVEDARPRPVDEGDLGSRLTFGLGVGPSADELVEAFRREHLGVGAVEGDRIGLVALLVFAVVRVDGTDGLELRRGPLEAVELLVGELVGRRDVHGAGGVEAEASDEAVLDAADERRHGDDRGDADHDTEDGEEAAAPIRLERSQRLVDEVSDAHTCSSLSSRFFAAACDTVIGWMIAPLPPGI